MFHSPFSSILAGGTIALAMFASAPAAEVLIDDETEDASDQFGAAPMVVFASDTNGYVFYVDNLGTGEPTYRKTTNGGASWGSAVGLGEDHDDGTMAVWYDRWTPDCFGRKIHIVYIGAGTTSSGGDDDLHYNYLDTADDSVGTWRTAKSIFAYTANNDGACSITKTTEGDLFAYTGYDSAGGMVARSTNDGVTWTDITPAACNDDNDKGQLLPLDNGDVLLIHCDWYSTLRSFVWTNATETWSPAVSIAEWDYGSHYWGATRSKTNDTIYLAGHSKPGDGGDLKAYKFSGSIRTWTTLSDVVEDTIPDQVVQGIMLLDENTDDLYAVYGRADTDIGSEPYDDVSIYYKTSTDDGVSWSEEIGPLNTSTTGTVRIVRGNFASDERLYAVWFDNATNKLYGATIIDLFPPPPPAGTVIVIR